MKAVCEICPHHCNLEEGQIGFCKARTNRNGIVTCSNYGRITSIALDPIEKKPLAGFYPGSRILSVGSYGCNLRCPFCQNHTISMACGGDVETAAMMPEELVRKGLEFIPHGNIGIAYTYNEPLIGYEFVTDCAVLAHKRNLKNVLVTNGYICEKPLSDLLPHIDAMNIDLKGFTDQYYRNLRADLNTVKQTITLASKKCHVEITTLIIPGENDSETEVSELAEWISGIDRDIPLHLTRFFPRYKYGNKTATDVDAIYRLADVARRNLKYVYTGNC